ncbi:MAG: hypothetical protein JNM00_13045 [Flavobacteriales bacterium]|nr:hypothetical protein [Flavobacteriales bacterium]
MEEINKKDNVGGLIFVGCILIGVAMGLWMGRVAIGALLGVGFGFLAKAALQMKANDSNNK